MKTSNRTYIRWTAFLLTLILVLSAAALPATAQTVNDGGASGSSAAPQGTLVISEICNSPATAKYEYMEIYNDSDVTVNLADYYLYRLGASNGGAFEHDAFEELYGIDVWNGKFWCRVALSASDCEIAAGETVLLWFCSTTETATVANFRSNWNLSNDVKVLQYKIFVDGNTSDKFSCDNINASAGYGFLPDSRAACVFSLVRKENAKFDNDTTPTMELISAQHKLSDCIAIMFLRGAATTTNARHYYGFVNADLYQTQKSNTYNWTYGTGTAKYAEWVDVSDVYARTLVGNAPDLGKCELRCYADWDAASDTDTSKMIEAYVFVKDGEKKAATPGKVQIDQFPAHLSVVAMQNKVGKTTQDVRFIGWVDSLNYTEVGVKIAAAYVDGNEKISKNGTQSITTDTVYATVTGGGQTYTTSSPEIGKNGTGHLIAAAVSGLNVTDDTHIIFYLTAFGVLADGTTVYGKTTSAVLNGTTLTNPNAEDGSYRIMTFNVLRANQRKDENSTVIDYKTIDYQSCMDSISAYGADVVGFEEYCTAFSQYLNPLLVQNGYTVLGATDTVTTDSSGVVNSTKQNMAPLAYKTSRFNLLDWGEGRVDGTYLGKEPKPYPGHWITWAVLQDKASGEVFSVATTHGFHRSNVTEKDAGQLQYHVPAMIDTIYSLMNNAKAKAVKGSDFTCPVVFVGDYNMKTNSDPYNAVFSGFTSHASYKTAYGVLADARFVALQGYTVGKAGHTWEKADRNYNDADMIDHIIVTESVGVIEHKICVSATTTAASDHYPVYVDIVLSNQ